jgi:hypothetical protein
MCIYGAISRDCDCHMNLTSLTSAPILHTDGRIGERTDYQFAYTIGHTGYMSTDITSSLLFEQQLAISTTKELFGSLEDPVDIQQPPPHVVDYWFDQLGLSLETSSSKNPSNATSSSPQLPMLDSTTYVR